MTDWTSFLVAEVGASAALAGLVFVGLSINLEKIMALPSLPSRALQAVVTLITVLIVGSLLLVPGEAHSLAGLQVLLCGLVDWASIVWLQVLQWRALDPKYQRLMWQHIVTGQLASLPWIIAGGLIIARGDAGYYWLVPGVIFSFLDASANAWVLLVEINR